MFCLVDKILASRASHVSNVQNCTTDLMASRLALGVEKPRFSQEMIYSIYSMSKFT